MMDDLGGDELDILDVIVQLENELNISGSHEQETSDVRLVSELLEVVGRHVSTIKLLLFVVMILGAGGGYMYVKNLQAENEILTLNNAKLNDAVEQQQAVIEQQLRDIETKDQLNEQLKENNAKLTADLNVANEKFNKVNASGERRDIGNLAISKPRSVQLIERKREQQRARCFEIAQGPSLTEEELNATKKSQINCRMSNIAN